MTEKLGDELQKRKDFNSAIICFILAKNIHKVVALWKHRLDSMIQKKPEVREAVMLSFLEKITFLKKAGDMRD